MNTKTQRHGELSRKRELMKQKGTNSRSFEKLLSLFSLWLKVRKITNSHLPKKSPEFIPQKAGGDLGVFI
jgi:hypothetical protein